MFGPSTLQVTVAREIGREHIPDELGGPSEAAQGPMRGRPNKSEIERAAYLQEVVHNHFADIWRFLRKLGFEKHVIDDAMQDLFFVVLRRIDDVAPERQRAFLIGAALRKASKLKRKRAREVLGEELDPAESTPTAEERIDDERARELGYRLLSELEESLRIVFVMYELEGMTMQEIADLTGVPLGTVASRLRRARDDFRARLERHRVRTRGLWGPR